MGYTYKLIVIVLLFFYSCKKTNTIDLYNLACEYEEKNEYAKAIDLLNQVLEVDPTDLEAYNNRAWDYKDLGNYNQSMNDFNNILHLDPKNTAGLYGKGIIYLNQKEYQKSIEMFDEVISITGRSSTFITINDDSVVGKRIPSADIEKVYFYRNIAEEKLKAYSSK